MAALLDAVGSDIRELARPVRSWWPTRAARSTKRRLGVTTAAAPRSVASTSPTRRCWAMSRVRPKRFAGDGTRVPHVLVADALAEAVHTIARVGPLSGDPYRLAGELGMPPWRVQKAQKQSRRWSGEIATAIRLVAALNGDVKGAAADADYVLRTRSARLRSWWPAADPRRSDLLERLCQRRLLYSRPGSCGSRLWWRLCPACGSSRPASPPPCPCRPRWQRRERADRSVQRRLHRLIYAACGACW